LIVVALGIALGLASLLLTLALFERFGRRRGLLAYLRALGVYAALGLPLTVYVLSLLPRWMP
jgi:hypothetical protein